MRPISRQQRYLLSIAVACASLTLAVPTEAKQPDDKPPGQSQKKPGKTPPGQAKKHPDGGANPLRNPYFGDLHVHTARSLDAGLQGVITTPAQAYEYAKGGPLTISGGNRVVQLARPMDFAAVTDHAEYFGNFTLCDRPELNSPPPDGELVENPIYDKKQTPPDGDYPVGLNCVDLRDATNAAFALTFALSWLPESSVIDRLTASNAGYCFDDGLQDILGIDNGGITGDGADACYFASLDFWQEAQEAAEGANDPGRFTAFKAWEWTGGPLSANLHRNIIFRDENVPERPISYFDAPFRGDIWEQLAFGPDGVEGNGDDYNCRPDQGDCQVLVIPHNSNLSQGRMFEPVQPKVGFAGGVSYEPMDEDYASTLGDYERLVEIMQHKGQSECLTENFILPSKLDDELTMRLSSDEYCDFEVVPWATLAGEVFDGTPKPQDFVRDALKVGMQLIDTDTRRACDPSDDNADNCGPGLNPFKYGIIASTDTHQGTPGMTNESTHAGHGGGGALFEDGEGCSPEDPDSCEPGTPTDLPQGLTETAEYGPGGLAVVWAESNTRDHIFEALQRKEVYGTSGTRPVVRFFGGFELPGDLCEQPDAIAQAYATGVPMGGELEPTGDLSKPSFMLSALMDPGESAVPGAGPGGKTIPARPGTRLQQIQIIKGWVDGSGVTQEEVVRVAGSADTGATVNTNNCKPVGKGKGSKSLCAVWTDEDFQADQNAFYYARVLEDPVCRWSTYQCNAAGITEQVCAAAEAGGPAIPEGFAKCCPHEYPVENTIGGRDPGDVRVVELPKTIQERAWTTPIWYERDAD